MRQKRKIGPVQSVGRIVRAPPARRAMPTVHQVNSGTLTHVERAAIALELAQGAQAALWSPHKRVAEHSKRLRRTALNHRSWPCGRIRAFGAANGTVPSTLDTVTSPMAAITSIPRDIINPLRHSVASQVLPESSRRHARHDGFRAYRDVIGIWTGHTYHNDTPAAMACARTHAVRRDVRDRPSGVRAPLLGVRSEWSGGGVGGGKGAIWLRGGRG